MTNEAIAMDAQDFRFVAFTANTRGPDRELQPKSVLLDIREHDEAADAWFKDIWDKMRQAVSNYYKTNDGMPGWVNWKPHEWARTKVAHRQKYVAWTRNVVAGFLYLRTDFNSYFDDSKPVMYVESIATAPGNKMTPLWCRRLTHVGRALLAFAVLQSVKQGQGGILGLHAADAEASGWYRDLNDKQGGRLFRPEVIGVAAPPPHMAEHRPYLEMTTNGCIEFLEGYRDG